MTLIGRADIMIKERLSKNIILVTEVKRSKEQTLLDGYIQNANYLRLFAEFNDLDYAYGIATNLNK